MRMTQGEGFRDDCAIGDCLKRRVQNDIECVSIIVTQSVSPEWQFSDSLSSIEYLIHSCDKSNFNLTQKLFLSSLLLLLQFL